MIEMKQEHRTRNVITFAAGTAFCAFGFAGQLFVEGGTPIIGTSWFQQLCILAAVILYIQGFVVEALAIRGAKQKIRQTKTEQETRKNESQQSLGALPHDPAGRSEAQG